MTEREAFEKWITDPPYERSTKRYPNDPTRYGFPNTYCEHDVDLCWLAWQQRSTHANARTMELVEAVHKYRSEMPECDAAGMRVRLNDLAALAAEIKAEQGGGE